MGLFAKHEERAISYQDLWGSDVGWSDSQRRMYSAGRALQLSAVIGCVGHRSAFFAGMPIVAYSIDAAGFPVPVTPQPRQIASPSGDRHTVRAVWLTQMSLGRDLWGNAIGLTLGYDAAGYPNQIDWLAPDSVSTEQHVPNGPITFRLDGRPLPPEDVVLVPSALNLPGSPLGIAPLQHAGLVDLAQRAQEFGADWFRNGAVPSSIIYADQELSKAQAEGIRDRVTAAWRNRRPGVLGSGLKLEHVKVEKNESQFLETMRHVQVDICQCFRVPPEELGIASTGSSITYANLEQKARAAVDRMNADLVIVQEVFTSLVPRTQFVRFNTGAELRLDTKSRYEAYAIALGGQPWMDVDEVRRLDDMRPMPNKPDPEGTTDDDDA